MNLNYIAGALALITATNAVEAAGVERTTQSSAVLFETGRYAEISFGGASPDVSGVAAAGLGGFGSGDLSPSFFQFGAAYKADLSETVSYAVIFDQPFGADVAYPVGTNYFAQGSTARLRANALTGLVKYKLPSNVSIYGGIRIQSLEASASIPFIAGYTAQGDRDVSAGYVVGVAYERPDIALRVALTYNSKIGHDIETTEASVAPGASGTSTTTVDTPESINLEFQTGIAADTLLFGSVRWVGWSDFNITPVAFSAITGGGSLLSYSDDTISYSIGIGRKLNENWSVAATLGYESSMGGFLTNLGPTDGSRSLGLAATYTKDNMKITGGIRYVDIGNALTAIPGNAPAGTFADNSAVAAGVKIGWSF
jgi:long-subunit fatty acid transport protein